MEKKYSSMFNTVSTNYKNGLWGSSLVKMAVKKGYITKEEFVEITGKEYK